MAAKANQIQVIQGQHWHTEKVATRAGGSIQDDGGVLYKTGDIILTDQDLHKLFDNSEMPKRFKKIN